MTADNIPVLRSSNPRQDAGLLHFALADLQVVLQEGLSGESSLMALGQPFDAMGEALNCAEAAFAARTSEIWFADAARPCQFWSDGRLNHWQVDGCFRASWEASKSRLTATLDTDDWRAKQELQFGVMPALLCNQMGRFLLHASAVCLDGRAFLLMGPSGAGKSTAAADLGQLPGIERLVDDIAPVLQQNGVWHVSAAFPQLKWRTQDSRPWLGRAESFPIAGLLVLHRVDGQSRLKLQAIDAQTAFKTLIAQSAGSRLFGPQLQARHWTQLQSLQQQLPMHLLEVPHCDEPALLSERIAELLQLMASSTC